MIIKQLIVGPIQANCFIVGCEQTSKAAVIDPGDEPDRILMELAKLKLKVECIINTHCHFDHVAANKRIKEVTKAPIIIHSLDAPRLLNVSEAGAEWGLNVDSSPAADQTVEDGDTINFGNITFTVLHTPGHTPGGISLYAEDAVFTGDTLFAGSIGRSDFPGGDHNVLIASIKNKLLTLPEHVRVYPGHMGETTIKREKSGNPFLI